MTLLRDSAGVSRRSRFILGLKKGALFGRASALSRFVPRFAGRPRPLWFGSRYTDQDRNMAVERGLRFISNAASDPRHFTEWGHDLMWCFYTIARTAKNAGLREMAHCIGRDRALEWRLRFIEPPVNDVDDLTSFVFGTDIADKLLGNCNRALKREIQEAVDGFSVVDFLGFDPRHEPPP